MSARRLFSVRGFLNYWCGLWFPAITLLSNEQEGLNRFVASVRDIQLFLRTYSHAGN